MAESTRSDGDRMTRGDEIRQSYRCDPAYNCRDCANVHWLPGELARVRRAGVTTACCFRARSWTSAPADAGPMGMVSEPFGGGQHEASYPICRGAPNGPATPAYCRSGDAVCRRWAAEAHPNE